MSSDTHSFSLLPQGEEDESPVSVPVTAARSDEKKAAFSNRWIVITACIYTFFILLLFTWPRYVMKHCTGDGLGCIAEGMGAVMWTGGTALLLSLAMLCVAIARWHSLSRTMRIIVLYPIVCSVLIIIVTAILANIMGDKNRVPTCPTEDGEDCPTPKNTTRLLARMFYE